MGNEKLFEAIKEDDFKKFMWALRQRDVNINATQQGTGSTALHLALGKSEFVKELLLYKPRLDIFDEEGFTPLHIAAKYGYVESHFLLVSYGADINAKRDEMSPTPLDLALQDDFSTTSVDYLLFCGAELTKGAKEKLGAEALEKHETILQGYESGKIKFQGKTLPVGEEWEALGQLQIAVQNLSDVEVELFCRRIEPLYQDYEGFTPKIPLVKESQAMVINDELKSDIFQMKIDTPAAFNLILPTYHKRGQKDNLEDTQYASLVLKICHRTLGRNVVTEATDIEYSDGKVTVYNAVLGIEGQSPVVAIAVFLRTKTEHRTLAAHQSEILESHTENNFRISTTEQTFDEPTDVALQVLKVVDTPEVTEKAQEVMGHSDFCSALSADTPAKDVITIQLPKPTIIASSSKAMCATLVMKCSQDDDGQKPENWSSVEDDVTETTDCVKLSKSGFGHYIVLAVKMLKKVGRNLKRLVSRLYSSASGKTTYCSLLAMTQKLNVLTSRSFTILCVLCRFDQVEDTIAKYEKDNYEMQPCSKSRTISVNTQQTYILTFELFNAKLMSKLKQLPLQYKDSHDSFQTITVEATGRGRSPHGNVFLLKRKVSEAKRKDVAFGEHIAVLVPVIFDVGNLSERPGDFLDDRILLEIAKKLGEDWFEILVGLGMSVMELKGLDMTKHVETNLLMLKRWRSKIAESEDRGLCGLLTSMTRAARIDLRRILENNLDQYIQSSWRPDPSPSLSNTDTVDAPLDPSSQDQFKKWLNGFRTEDDTLKIDVKTLINEKVMSPFEDSFLFYISQKIVGDDLIPLKLGLSGSKFEDMKHINPSSRRMCQMLAVLKAAQTEDPPCSFIRQLLKEIKNTGNELAVMEIEERIREWYERYKRGGSGFSKAQMETIKQRLRIDLETK